MITSSQNAKIKLVRALQGRSRERRESNAFVAEGVRLVEEAVHRSSGLKFVLYDESLSERGMLQVESLKSRNLDVEMISTALMKSLSETDNPQGILAVLEFPNLPIPDLPDFILVPDQIRDPGNLGTLLRSAAATGVEAVLIPPDTTDAFAPKVVRSGMGAHFRLPIHAMTWEEIEQFSKLSNLPLLIADMDGPSCWETDLRRPLVLIVGSEAEGASDTAQKLATQKISIPMAGNVESLNAGVAGSVLLFEVVRQRSVNNGQ